MSYGYDKLVSSLRDRFASGVTRPVEWRVRQLEALVRLYDENAETLVDALRRDLRKPRLEAFGTEIDFLRNDCLTCLRELRGWVRPRPARKTTVALLDRVEVRPEPYGVALIIGAWNYPLHLSLAPLSGAIAAGNCAVVKPSEISPHTARAIEELLARYVDPDCFKVVNGGVPETTELLKERFDYIFYTGSTAVGRIIARAASAHLTPCTLELGGKSPVYVADDCPNLERVAKRLLWGKTINMGQTCIAPDYVLCSPTMQGRLAEKMGRLLKEWYGEKVQASADMCRIVSERHFDRLVKLLESSSENIAIGGKHDRSSLYIDPTIIKDVDPSDPVMQEEIFGPILPMISVSSAGEAIKFINDREKPLVVYLFTEDQDEQERFARETSSGCLVANECMLQMGVETLPFGGVGASGMGVYHGQHTFETFSHMKPVLLKDLGWLGEYLGALRYPPYKDSSIPVLQLLLKSRWLPMVSDFKMVGGMVIGAAATAIMYSL